MIRMMSPDGTIGEIPEDSLQAALDAGYRVMTDFDMTQMFNRIAMEDRRFNVLWDRRHRPIYKPLRFRRA